jgi:hypothetical protein
MNSTPLSTKHAIIVVGQVVNEDGHRDEPAQVGPAPPAQPMEGTHASRH